MSDVSPSRVDRFKKWTHNQPVVAVVVIFFGVIVALGAVVGSVDVMASAIKKVRTPDDPRVFQYRGQTVRLTEGNGMTFEQPVVVTGAFTTDAGVQAQYSWIRRFYRGYNLICHGLVIRDAKRYDVFVLRSPTAGERRLHFDVTSFFATPDSEPEAPDTTTIGTKQDLYTADPKTPAERNANSCAEIEGTASLTASPMEGGSPVRRLSLD